MCSNVFLDVFKCLSRCVQMSFECFDTPFKLSSNVFKCLETPSYSFFNFFRNSFKVSSISRRKAFENFFELFSKRSAIYTMLPALPRLTRGPHCTNDRDSGSHNHTYIDTYIERESHRPTNKQWTQARRSRAHSQSRSLIPATHLTMQGTT